MCEWFYYASFIFIYIPISLFIHFIYFALICQHVSLPCVFLILLACFSHVFICIYTVYICIYVYVYIVTLKGFLHYSPMNSDSDCSVLPFMPIFCIYAHNSLSVRGCVWMGPAWVPLGVRRGNRTESRLTFAPCLLRPKLLLLQYNTRRY